MRPRPPIAAPVAALLVVLLAVASCEPSARSASPLMSASPTSSSPPVSSPAAWPAPSTAGAVVVDQALLEVLPEQIEGRPLIRDVETAAGIVAGGGLPTEVDALAVGLYVGPGSSTSDDLAVVNVVRLRAGTFAQAWFRSWRETFDIGACERSGGVEAGASEAEIAGRTVYIGTCRGGVHTYHVRLADPDRLVSITSLGDARYGERVVAGLTE